MKQQTMTIQPRETKMNAIQTTSYSDNTIYVSNQTSMNQLHYLKQNSHLVIIIIHNL